MRPRKSYIKTDQSAGQEKNRTQKVWYLVDQLAHRGILAAHPAAIIRTQPEFVEPELEGIVREQPPGKAGPDPCPARAQNPATKPKRTTQGLS